MQFDIESVKKQIIEYKVLDAKTLEDFRIVFLSKNGIVSRMFEAFKTLEPDLKKKFGQELNLLKKFAQDTYDNHKQTITEASSTIASSIRFELSAISNTKEVGIQFQLSVIG